MIIGMIFDHDFYKDYFELIDMCYIVKNYAGRE